MIKIHHIEGRRSERVAWLLEEIGNVPYELEFIPGDILGSLMRLEKIHETRMTPIIEDGDLIMIESGAILEYLLARYGKGSPLRPREDSPAFPRYLEFMHYAEGSGMARILTDFIVKGILDKAGMDRPAPLTPGLAGSRTESQRVMYFADNVLAARRYFAGDTFTAADIMMHFPLKAGAPVSTGNPLDVPRLYDTDHDYFNIYPNVKRFMSDVSSRPAFQRAIKRTLPNGPPSM